MEWSRSFFGYPYFRTKSIAFTITSVLSFGYWLWTYSTSFPVVSYFISFSKLKIAPRSQMSQRCSFLQVYAFHLLFLCLCLLRTSTIISSRSRSHSSLALAYTFALVLGVGTVSSLMWYLLDSFFVRIKRRYWKKYKIRTQIVLTILCRNVNM